MLRQQSPGGQFRRGWGRFRRAGEGAEPLRPVDRLPDGPAEAGGACHADGPAAGSGDHRLLGAMGLQGQLSGAVGLHQHVVRQSR